MKVKKIRMLSKQNHPLGPYLTYLMFEQMSLCPELSVPDDRRLAGIKWLQESSAWARFKKLLKQTKDDMKSVQSAVSSIAKINPEQFVNTKVVSRSKPTGATKSRRKKTGTTEGDETAEADAADATARPNSALLKLLDSLFESDEVNSLVVTPIKERLHWLEEKLDEAGGQEIHKNDGVQLVMTICLENAVPEITHWTKVGQVELVTVSDTDDVQMVSDSPDRKGTESVQTVAAAKKACTFSTTYRPCTIVEPVTCRLYSGDAATYHVNIDRSDKAGISLAILDMPRGEYVSDGEDYDTPFSGGVNTVGLEACELVLSDYS